jgi:hypothetical protein
VLEQFALGIELNREGHRSVIGVEDSVESSVVVAENFFFLSSVDGVEPAKKPFCGVSV